jgi:hypothetical protein
LDKEARERKIFVNVAGALMVCALSYGLFLIANQHFNAKKRAGSLPAIAFLHTSDSTSTKS